MKGAQGTVLGWETILYDTVIVDTRHYTLVHTHEMHIARRARPQEAAQGLVTFAP